MKTRFFLLLTLFLSGLMLLSACTAAPTEAPPEEPQETPYPYPAPEVIYEQPNPYPDSQEAIVEVDGNDPYPGIEVDGTTSNDPYPGVDIEDNASDLGMAEALTAADFAVLPDDGELKTGPVFIDHSEIIMKESFPVQVELVLSGNLPTPCNKLRIVSAEPDEFGHIEIEAYSVSDPDVMCTQTLKPFIAVVPLGEYTDGTYTVAINNVESGDFQLP